MADDENDHMFAEPAFGDEFGDELGEEDLDEDIEEADAAAEDVDVVIDPNDPRLQVNPKP